MGDCREWDRVLCSRGAARGGGAKPVEKLVQLICLLYVPLGHTTAFPLEAGYLSHPTLYIPGLISQHLLLQFFYRSPYSPSVSAYVLFAHIF